MIPYGFKEHQRQSEHHLLLASIAILLSVVVHILLMYFFADWSLGAMSRLQTKKHEWLEGDHVPPMRVQTLTTDPLRGGNNVVGERDMPSRGPKEVTERVKSLSEPANTALSVPLPISREVLAHVVPAVKELALERIDTTPLMPRQEIVQIFDRSVQDAVATLPRRELPQIERVIKAPDIVPSIDLTGRRFSREPELPKPIKSADILDKEISKGTVSVFSLDAQGTPSQLSADATEELFGLRQGEKTGNPLAFMQAERMVQEQMLKQQVAEQPLPEGLLSAAENQARVAQAQITALQETVDYKAIDDLLAVGLETYRDPEEAKRIYFRIAIQPRTDKKLPTIAKDVVFVQDVSASMTEERLIYCRRALAVALTTLNPDDRFNVVAFRDTFTNCFSGWVTVTDKNVRLATDFVGKLRSYGQTDVFGSLRSLITLPRDPQRPMIGLIVTDGKPTFGVTQSAPIIGDFTKLNKGMISIYMFGAQRQANRYLLDMLTYCNRGSSTVLAGNRWDIPSSMTKVYEGFRYPVLSDITVVFDAASGSEVYPNRTVNLYRGQQLTLSGVCMDTTEELIMQVRGLAADKGFDAIIRLNMKQHAKPGSVDIRTQWAHQKMYYLVSAYTRESHRKVMADMVQLHTRYGVLIPYAKELK